MVGDEGDTPTRYELLSMVKKHSSLIGKTNVEEQDPSDVEMDPKFWHDVFDFYFIRGKESRGRQDDDLLFFVRKMRTHSDPPNESPDGVSPYFVRRWASELDKLLGDSSDEVDWRRSFYLNLIAHTSFTVTVAICSHEVLRNHQSGQDTPLSPIYKVVKTVYASPSRVNFHLDSKKEVETTPAYPDICFAVDDFDSTFDAVVLSSTDHCYCVLLNAHDGAAFPTQKEQNDCISSSDTPLRTEASSGNSKSIKITLFSGFVSYQMVREAYNAGKSQFGGLWSLGHSLGKQDRLYMKGPGGRGEVEVAVSGVIEKGKQKSSTGKRNRLTRGFGIGSIVRKAASVASVAAKHAYAVASATTSHDDELMIPLKCCLMSISLPWEHIAYDLLFKGSPPVNL
ncbi:hypothetical protein ACJRO7_024166 [Eucalyptus globulus]|uniref:Cw7 protein n=1 Tax=Eucalyptus globulus TaxID=34317 RepID=A0ABD3K4K6_EUCGL